MAKKKVLSLEEKLEEALIPKEEQPYQLPENWEWVRLGSIVNKPQYGYTTKASVKGEIKFLRTTDITKKNFDWNNVPYCLEKPSKIENYLLEVNDILISRSGSIGENFRIEHLDEKESVFASYMIRIKPKLGSKYLDKLFKSELYWTQIAELGSGNTLKNISAPKIQSIKIPLPTKSEQERIVKKLEDMLSKIREAKELISEARETFELRRASILHKAFTGELTKKWREDNPIESGKLLVDNLLEKINEEKMAKWEEESKKAVEEGKRKPKKPVIKPVDEMKVPLEEEPYELPEGWGWVRLGEVIDLISDYHANGAYKKLKEKVELLNEKNYSYMIRSTNFEKNNFTTLMKYITKDAYEFMNKSKLFGNEILISKIGNAGKVYLMPKLDKPASLAMNLFLVRISKQIISKYIYLHLNTVFSESDIRSYLRGITTQTITKDSVRNLLISLPPLNEQKEIVKKIEAMLDAEEKAKELLDMENQIELLEKSILSKAFRGELGTNDINDEPAMELLRRVLDAK